MLRVLRLSSCQSAARSKQAGDPGLSHGRAVSDEIISERNERDMTTKELQRELINSLVADDSYDLADGRMLRLIEESDPFTDIRDYADCYGIVEWIAPGRRQHERPAMFDGAAYKLWINGDCYWWQPPADIIGNDEAVKGTCRAVCDLLEHGTSQLRVELCDGADVYGRPIVREFAVIGGIEWGMTFAVKADYVADLVAELDLS